MRLVPPVWRPPPLLVPIAATICAAGLVLFLQHRALSTLQFQTDVILRQMSEQTAADVAVELQHILDGPVFDTLTAVNHPELRAGRLDLVAQKYEAGLKAYPHVESFFVWSAQTERTANGEALFYGRDGRFRRDPELGRAVMELARRHAASQQIYLAAEDVGREGHQVFIRLFWTDASRREYFAVLGFVVDPQNARGQLFTALRERKLDTLLSRRGTEGPLGLTVTDEYGALVYGQPIAGAPSGRVTFPLLFYPGEEIQSRLAAGVEPRNWIIEVHAPRPVGQLLAQVMRGYGPTVLSILLMLAALALTAQAQRRSADLAQMQTDFVAHVSHQLKTPLSLLSAATETLQMDRVRSPERFAEYLATIHAEAARLTLLVQRVLEFSRVQQRRNYEFEQVDLGALVRETVDAFAHSLCSQHFAFDVQQEGPSPTVRADPAALEQVLANLLDNAVKYSGAIKQITVRVASSREEATVDIIDRGIGISPADQQRIFDRFYRTSSTHDRRGFGLGLSIVRELMQAHRGRVEVASVVGEGSTFRIALPREVVLRPLVAPAGAEVPKAAS